MKTKMKKIPLAAGFTLIEMAMVLMIIALVLGGLLPTISAQIEQQRNAETRKQLVEIREAIISFAVAHNRLPCPADGTLNTGVEAVTGAGTALVCSTINGNASSGVVPWAALGVSETDAWGRRFSYKVTSAFADGTDGTNEAAAAACATSSGVSFKMCSEGNLNTLIAAAGSNLASNLPAIVVSHGPNGKGAYTHEGVKLADSSDADELDNSNASNSFVSHEATPTFDDLLVWVAPNLLVGRMITAGKLP